MKPSPAAAFVCSFVLLIGTALNSQTKSEIIQDPQGLQVSVQSLAAQGAKGKPVPIRATGKIHYEDGSDDGVFELLVSGPRVYRTNITKGEYSYSYTVNQDAGVVVDNGKRHLMPNAHVMSGWCPYLPLFGFLNEVQQGLLSVESVKAGNINGADTFIVATTTVDAIDPDNVMSSRNEFELDAKTLLPLKFRTPLRNHANPQIVNYLEYAYGDYRQEGAYLIPHTVTTVNGDQLHSTITFDSFEVGASLPVSAFDLVQK